MLTSIGRAIPARHSTFNELFSKNTFQFETILPTEFTYTRNDTVATYRDSNGDWQQSTLNAPRFDHDSAGRPKGIRIEPPRTNKANHANFAPVNIGGIVPTSGDGIASVVADTSFATATMKGSNFLSLQNGNVIALTGGSGGTTYRVSLDAGNTNPHSYRILTAPQGGGYHGNVKLNSGSGINNYGTSNGVWEEIIEQNITVNHSTRYLAIYVTAGNTVHVGAIQFEEGGFLSSPIITTNASGASRTREVCVALGLDTVDWFDTNQGTIICEAEFDQVTGFDQQYAFLANEGTGLSNSMGMYLVNNTASQMRARDIIDSTNNQNNDIHKPIIGKRFPCALSWRNGESYAIAGPMRYEHVERAGAPNNMDRIYIGGRPFNGAMSGWIKSLTVYNKFRTLTQIGQDMFPNTLVCKAIASGGQSNKHGWFRSQTELSNGGEASAINEMDQVWTSSENWMINGAENGSYAIKQNDPNADTPNENWWYDPVTDTFGNRMQQWENIVTAFGVDRIEVFDWDQGESDSDDSKEDLKQAWIAIFNRMRQVAGNKPVFITSIGRRGDGQNTNYNTVRQAQRELVAENTWIYRAPEKFTQDLTDQVHLTDAGYANHATMHTRYMLQTLGEAVSGGATPPMIGNAVRGGANISVAITHGAGTDIAPSSDIAGFHFFDDGVEIPITSSVRTNATTITLALASTPTGSETLYYGYGSLYDEVSTYGNLVTDDTGLPLWSDVINL